MLVDVINHIVTSLRRRTGKPRFPCHDHGAQITETSHVMFGAFLRLTFIYCLRNLPWNLNISTLKRTIIFNPPSYLGSSCYFSGVYHSRMNSNNFIQNILIASPGEQWKVSTLLDRMCHCSHLSTLTTPMNIAQTLGYPTSL